jgi:hypothetical protein
MSLTMKIAPLILIAVGALGAHGQRTFNIDNASRYFNIKVETTGCDSNECVGRTTFSFSKKGGSRPYQVIAVPETYIDITRGGKPLVNTTVLYDEQSVVHVDDFNFDGMEDVAICNGRNGSYGASSYDIYLSNRATGKFVLSRPLTRIADRLSMFTVLKEKKQLETFDKSGCCWHIVQRYKVDRDRPVLVFEEVEDATAERVKTTTKKLVNGRMKRSVKYEKKG